MGQSNQTTTNDGPVSVSRRELTILASALSRRLRNAETFDGERNVWESCGYPWECEQSKMELRYKRFGLARRIVDAFPDACWSKPPEVLENEDDKETEFEAAWKSLVKEFRVFSRLHQLDRLAGRGKCAVLLIGLDDGKALRMEPAAGPHRVIYLRPYHPDKVEVFKKETDPRSPRFGAPTMYTLRRKKDQELNKMEVHWKRIIHLSDTTDDNDWEGEHRLKKVWNHILDIEKIAGGGAEMFWKGGFPITLFNIDKEITPTSEDLTAMNSQISDVLHGLTRSLKFRGVTAETLKSELAQPAGHFLIQVQLISAATGIPQRVLLGSEMAKLASEQDSRNWLDKVHERRVNYCQGWILEVFVERLQLLGALPAIKEPPPDADVDAPGPIVRWPDLQSHTDKDEAEVGKLRTEALAKFAGTAGTENVIDLFHWLTEFMGFDRTTAQSIVDGVDETSSREDEQPEEEEPEFDEGRNAGL